jgi:predicted flap endonuclease-1-like 5' DNA nuclease
MNPWLALVIGILIGWVLEWLLELFYFRRKRVHLDAKVEELQAGLDRSSVELEAAREEARLLAAELAAAQPVASGIAPAPTEAYDGELVPEVEEALEEDPGAPGGIRTVVQPPWAPVRDDLTEVAGIGPKYAERLAAAGITSFALLAAASPDQVESAVQPARGRPRDYGEWIAQAAVLAGSPRVRAIEDDFTLIEGIGPVYRERLARNGIATFVALSSTDPGRLDEVIGAPAWRRPNFEEWIEQARLAAAGDDEGLRDLQARLFARKGDNLRLIRGVGPATQAALESAGVHSFAELSTADRQQLAQALVVAGLDTGTLDGIIEEARLRAAGQSVPGRTRSGARSPERCPQDLTQLDGIGRVYAHRLYEAGIGTFWEVATSTDEDITAAIRHPGMGPAELERIRQAALALARDTASEGRTWDGTVPDDLEALAGIGSVFAARLLEASICTYRQLANVPPERVPGLAEQLKVEVDELAGWISQARRSIGEE